MTRNTLKRAGLAATAAALAFGASPASAVTVSSGDTPLLFTWSYSSSAGLLTGSGSMTVSGWGTSSLTTLIYLSNTSGLSSNRLTSFGFGINPDATGISFSDTADGGMVNASLANIPSLATIEVCAFGGPNCSGGGSGGILGGASDTFSIILAGTWGTSVDIDPIGFKYQTGAGSFEFTTSSGGSVPEPGTLSLLGLGLLGIGFMRRARKAA